MKNFVREWMETLEKIRGLSKELAKLGKRPTWVREDAHPTVHFDQFLHAYYPRNNRTNKALRALGHDVKLFSSG